MNFKKVLSFLLSLVIISGLFAVPVFASEETANSLTAYITISKYGEFAKDVNGNTIAALPVELTGKNTYTLDDAFKAVHDLYYDGGSESGYLSSVTDWGLSVTKLWGDDSGNFGYQINRGTESVMGLSHEIENGDFIDAYILKNLYPNSESYTTFDKTKAEIFVNEELELTLSEAAYDENWNTVFNPCNEATITVNNENADVITDSDGKSVISFETAGKYIISAEKYKELDTESVPAITAPVCVVTVKDYPDACITVPSDVNLFVGAKTGTHFVSFTEIVPSAKKENSGTTQYYFELEDNKTYNYRITSENYITYAGKFKKTADFNLEITEDLLFTNGMDKKSVDRDIYSNNGYNVADIYLNINPQGYLNLNENETYQLVNLRSWEAVDSVTANYFIEPDYHYTVIDENGAQCSDVITISESGLITANDEGTAIVLVTYDAMNLNFNGEKVFYGAIWPENTGVFVVNVGADESGILTNMILNEGKNSNTIKLSGDAIDAEHDCIYYMEDTGFYTFTPETEDCTVYIANPEINSVLSYNGFAEVEKSDDGSFKVPLTTGRNIVKITQGENYEYQIITAKKVNVTVNGGEKVHTGDELSIVFDTLYHPANKLAGVYNMNAVPVYTKVSGYDGKVIGGLPAQYNFASNENAQTVCNILKEKNSWGVVSYQKDDVLTVPADYAYDTFTLSGGMLYSSGFGDAYGNHRGITLESGKAPNLTAEARLGWLGQLPDIEIPIAAPSAELISISLDTENVKTDYFAGDSFDTTNLTVTANYADEKTQITTNYTIAPEILTKDTKSITVTYHGKTAEMAVNVSTPKVSAIEVTTPPAKTSYNKGDTFSPTGMVITAVYENGARRTTTNYSYAPNRTLEETDTKMTITYTGDDAIESIETAAVPITVKASGGSSSGSSSKNITVYFTLYGDEKHGEPDDSTGTHTLADNNLDTWVSKTAVTLEKGSHVIDAVEKALSIAGIPYNNDDNYISSIKGLKEFDNGSLSGWMYTLNGKYPKYGMEEQELKNGDKIIIHYTDDYTKEEDETISSSDSGSSSKRTKSTMPAAEIIEMPAEAKATEFKDISESEWYSEAVSYVTVKKLMNGVSETEFAPNEDMTRAMLVTVLYRMEHPKNKGNKNIFSDIKDGEWYTDAVLWAAGSGIINGVSETKFAPDENITREQIATIIYRYAKFKNIDTKTQNTLTNYSDSESVSKWALDAIKWANGHGLISGTSDTTLSPSETATRAQVAAILMRLSENILNK